MKTCLMSFFLMLMFAFAVFTQVQDGRLAGTIASPDGNLPGAVVTVISNQTGKELTATTNDSGYFSFIQLEAGTYTVKVTAEGFKTLVANNLKIDVAREYTFDRILELGEITETVTVTAGADVVTSTTAQVTSVVSPQQILSLPLITVTHLP